jgi:hypothetical protein
LKPRRILSGALLVDVAPYSLLPSNAGQPVFPRRIFH